jgi:hypothetical protein
MKVRFQADADLNQIILLATVRREPAVDFQTAPAAGLSGVADPEVLARAAKDSPVLVTHDRKTMSRHFSEFIADFHGVKSLNVSLWDCPGFARKFGKFATETLIGLFCQVWF